MKIHSASGELAAFIAEHKPKTEPIRGEALRPILEAAGYEIVDIPIYSEPKGLRRQRKIEGYVPGIEKNDQQYRLDQLTLEIWWTNEFVDDDGNLAIVPHAHLSAAVPGLVSTGYVHWGNTQLAEKAGHSTVRFPLPDKVVQLPAPEWVEAWAEDQAWIVVPMMFLGEAQELAKAFRETLAGSDL